VSIQGTVAFVSGANRGLGEAFTRHLLDNGAAKAYGGARVRDSITVPGVVPV
jgi:NAD(P)-dependent dehydrogenase (short-subunit alcohol dehydrogenase family)